MEGEGRHRSHPDWSRTTHLGPARRNVTSRDCIIFLKCSGWLCSPGHGDSKQREERRGTTDSRFADMEHYAGCLYGGS